MGMMERNKMDERLEPADSEAREEVGRNVGTAGGAEKEDIEGEGDHIGNRTGGHLNYDRDVGMVEIGGSGVDEVGKSRVKEEGKQQSWRNVKDGQNG